MLDPLGVITKTRTALDEEEAVMADAPDTIKTNEELKRQQMENYFYVPGMGEVPELDVPIALPNLLGTVLVIIKLMQFPFPVRLCCGSVKLIFVIISPCFAIFKNVYSKLCATFLNIAKHF